MELFMLPVFPKSHSSVNETLFELRMRNGHWSVSSLIFLFHRSRREDSSPEKHKISFSFSKID